MIKLIPAAVMLFAGAAMAFAQSPTRTNPAGRSDRDAISQPTLSPSAEEAHNPLVNPSAAATQRRWKGYGAASSAAAAHRIGSDNSSWHLGLAIQDR